MHTREQNSPLSCASKSPDGPSVLPLCPAWCQASGAHWSPAQFSTHFLAGRQCDSPSCWRSNANRHSLLLFCGHMSSKKRLSLYSVIFWVESWDKPTAWLQHIQKCFNDVRHFYWQIWITSVVGPMFHWQRLLLCHSMRNVQKWQRMLIKKKTAEDGISDEDCGELSEPDKAEAHSSNHKQLFYFYWNDWRDIRAKIMKTSTYIHVHVCTNLYQHISTVTSLSKTSKQWDVGCRSLRENPPFYVREVEGLLSSCPVA